MKKRAQKKMKHKPNARHTLSEVLHSLQDIVNNELANITDENSDKLPTNTTPTLSKEDVMNSLRELIGDVAAVDNTLEQISPDKTPENKIVETEPAMDEDQDSEATAEEGIIIDDSIDQVVVTPDDVEFDIEPNSNEALAINDAEIDPAPANEFKLEIEDPYAEKQNAIKNSRVGDNKNKERISTDMAKAASIGVQAEINWDDIPVLHEVVAPPPETGRTTTREAREIAIKVAAALNIESRKKGGGSMDIKTIMRLQSLLSQELQDRQDDDAAAGDNVDDDTRGEPGGDGT